MNLYPISQRYAQALIELSDNPEQWAKDTLEAIDGEFQEASLAVASAILNSQSEEEQVKAFIEKASERLKYLQGRRENWKHQLQTAMQHHGISKISSPLFNIALRKNPPSVEILDETQIPKEFIKIKTTESIDKTAIKQAIADGKEIAGAKLADTSYNLQIK